MKLTDRLVVFVIILTAATFGHAGLPGTRAAAAQLAPSTAPAGHFKVFKVPTSASGPRHITLGPDGNMWFTEGDINVSQIGRIDAAGNVTEFVVPTRFSQPSDIVSGPDGAL